MLIKAPIIPDKLIEAIYINIEAEAAKEPPRNYVGASSIGDECELKLWMQYRHAHLAARKKTEIIDGKLMPGRAELIMAANDGHRGEDLMAGYLRQVPGVELTTHDANGKQLSYSDLRGEYQGHWDGLILGVSQAPKTMHTWEHKVKNQKFYDALTKLKEKYDEKEVLQQWDYKYYCQAVTYMHYNGTTRHYTTVALAGSRKFQSIRTNENPRLAKLLREKAERITKYPCAPGGISTNPSWFACKYMCDFSKTCPSINKNINL